MPLKNRLHKQFSDLTVFRLNEAFHNPVVVDVCAPKKGAVTAEILCQRRNLQFMEVLVVVFEDGVEI